MAQKVMIDHLLYLLFGTLIVMNIQVHCESDVEKVNATYVEGAVAKGAVCLDGSPAAYHHIQGFGDGSNNWMVYLYGGGWCTNDTECLNYNNRGSIGMKPLNLTGIFSKSKTINPDFYNWNRVGIKYCDGSSYMGDVEAVDPKTNIHHRGARVFKAVIEELLTKGLANATNVILAGNSAGGLSTMLNCDRFRAFVPNASRVKCVADSGFFIRAKDLPGVEERESYYSRLIQYHNIGKLLPSSCASKMDPNLCIFPENFVQYIQTPLFILNSDFDRYQIKAKLKPHPVDEPLWQNCTMNLDLCTPGQLQIIKDFRTTFLKTLEGVGNSPSRGLFITSCYIHDFFYSSEIINGKGSPRLGNKSIIQAIGDWYFDRCSFQEIDTKNDTPLVNCFTS